MTEWSLQDAKSRFSAVVDAAIAGVPASVGVRPISRVSETMRQVPRTSCASAGRSLGTTPRHAMSAASSTANSVPSMKFEK